MLFVAVDIFFCISQDCSSRFLTVDVVCTALVLRKVFELSKVFELVANFSQLISAFVHCHCEISPAPPILLVSAVAAFQTACFMIL